MNARSDIIRERAATVVRLQMIAVAGLVAKVPPLTPPAVPRPVWDDYEAAAQVAWRWVPR